LTTHDINLKEKIAQTLVYLVLLCDIISALLEEAKQCILYDAVYSDAMHIGLLLTSVAPIEEVGK
jgi:hypothetical protein